MLRIYLSSHSLHLGKGGMRFYPLFKGGGVCLSRKTGGKGEIDPAKREVENRLRLAKSEEKKGNPSQALTYYEQALKFETDQESVRRIRSEIERLQHGEISPGRGPDSAKIATFHETFKELIRTLTEENDPERVRGLLNQLHQYDPNEIRSISQYYDELFALIEGEAKFRARWMRIRSMS